MSTIGSFALIAALTLSGYCFLAGLLALLFSKHPASVAIGETARRAGIAAFAAVVLAGIVLVVAAFNNDFSISYIFHHSNRDLPAAYKFAVLCSGRCSWPATGSFSACATRPISGCSLTLP
jgi:cytochrome c-type biogenesis protein CcmF